MYEQRRDPRVFLKLSVKLEKDNKVYYLNTVNISRRGAFIETTEPFDLDEVFKIDIYLPEKTISTQGKVVWVSYPNEKSNYIPGIGIKFLSMSIEDIDYLGSFLGKEIKKHFSFDRFEDVKERICLFNTDFFISETSSKDNNLVLFLNEVGNFFDHFSEAFFDTLDESAKKYYEIKKDTLKIGDSLLLTCESETNRINYIILVLIPTFYDSYGEELLRNAILSLLKKANEHVFMKLYIPAFILFETGFPIPVIARILLGTIYGFIRKEAFPRIVLIFCGQYDEQSGLIFEKVMKEM